jgi:transposase
MCNRSQVLLVFLPPYSPDFNPIEESFAELKAWMKKNNALLSQFDGDFKGFIELGIEMMANKAGNHYRSCHIST